jgi:hypothetical protein
MEFIPFSTTERILVALFLLLSLAIFSRDFSRRLAILLKGKSDRSRLTHLSRRVWVTTKEVLFQSRVLSGRPVAGVMHAAVFGGFVFFALETI